MEIFSNALKAHAGQMDMRLGQPRMGIVSSVQSELQLAKVRLQPGNLVTGWLPILSQWIGSGWGLVSSPSPGDQVLVIPQEGYYEHGIIVGYCRSEKTKAPNAPIGEFWVVHKSGSSIRLSNDGKIYIKGDLHVDGDIYDRTGSLDALRLSHRHHRHQMNNGAMSSLPVTEA